MPEGFKMSKKILLLDESGIFIRNALGCTKDLETSDGLTTGGVFGYINTVLGVLARFKPDHIIAAIDSKQRQLFRKDRFPAYKANRKKNMKEEIKDWEFQKKQLQKFHELFCIPMVEVPGYEADDVIASLATQYSKDGHQVFILSKDKDFVQLINKNTKLIILGKHDQAENFEVIDHKDDLANVFGVDPKKADFYQCLVGDVCDNVPGCPGVGPAAAKKILAKYGTLEEMYKNLDDEELFCDKKGKPNKIKDTLTRSLTNEEIEKYMLEKTEIRTIKQLIQISRELVRLDKSLNLNRNLLLKDYWSEINPEKLIGFFEDLEFHSFIMLLKGE